MSTPANESERRKQVAAAVSAALPYVELCAEKKVAHDAGEWSFIDFEHPGYTTWLADDLRMGREEGYRRGFYHGYLRAMNDLQSDCKPSWWQHVERFYDGALTRWRYARSKEMDRPPDVPREAA